MDQFCYYSLGRTYNQVQLRFRSYRKGDYCETKNQRYRKERGLPINPNASGVLTDGSDFSYLDGRIAPLAQGQKRRILRNEESKLQIIALSKEIDFAIERYQQIQDEESRKKQHILDRKLKPKGAALLSTS